MNETCLTNNSSIHQVGCGRDDHLEWPKLRRTKGSQDGPQVTCARPPAFPQEDFEHSTIALHDLVQGIPQQQSKAEVSS